MFQTQCEERQSGEFRGPDSESRSELDELNKYYLDEKHDVDFVSSLGRKERLLLHPKILQNFSMKNVNDGSGQLQDGTGCQDCVETKK